MRSIFLVAVILLSPTVVGSGTIVQGPVRVEFDNGRTSDCVDPATGLCLVSAKGGDPSSMDIGAHQRIDHVSILVVDGEYENLTGIELLPDQSLRIDRSTFRHEHPVIMLLDRHVGYRSAPAPFHEYGVVVTEERYGARYYRPEVNGTSAEMGYHDFTDNHYPEGYVENRTIGPFPSPRSMWWSDWEIDGMGREICTYGGEPACFGDGGRAFDDTVKSATPNASIGFEFREAGVGAADHVADDAGAFARTLSSGGVGPRAIVPLPDARLEREPTTRGALPYSGAASSTTPYASPAPSALFHPSPPAARGGPWDPSGREGSRIGAIAAASVGFALLVAAAIALFSRIRKEDAASSQKRAAILQLLQARGPQRLADVTRELGCDRSTAEHHARILAKTGHIELIRDPRQCVLRLPSDAATPAPPPLSTAQQRILETLSLRDGKLPRDELYRLVDELPVRTRNHALSRLVERGMVRREGQGHREFVTLVGGAQAA